MAATKTGGRRRPLLGESVPSAMCAPLGHPLRVRILQVANERDISPSGFVDEGLQPKGISFESRSHGLSHVSYHFRELEKAGCIEVVQTMQRRGATEHIYRGCARVEFTTEEFSQLPKQHRRDAFEKRHAGHRCKGRWRDECRHVRFAYRPFPGDDGPRTRSAGVGRIHRAPRSLL